MLTKLDPLAAALAAIREERSPVVAAWDDCLRGKMKKRAVYVLLNANDDDDVARFLGCSKSTVRHWPDPVPAQVTEALLVACLRHQWKRSKSKHLTLNFDAFVVELGHRMTQASKETPSDVISGLPGPVPGEASRRKRRAAGSESEAA